VGGVSEASVAELHEMYDGAFVRYQLTEESVRGAWRLGDAMVVDQQRDRHGRYLAEPVLYCLGKAGELAPLLGDVAGLLPGPPVRVSIEAHAVDALPAHWQHTRANRWDAMWTDSAPAHAPGEERVGSCTTTRRSTPCSTRRTPTPTDVPVTPGCRPGWASATARTWWRAARSARSWCPGSRTCAVAPRSRSSGDAGWAPRSARG
jgi:hypothetical protein